MAEPSTEQWIELHEAFREYCQAAPWQFFDDTHLVTVEHPSGEDKGYCVVLGSGGMEYGLAMYRGDEGLAGYLALMSGAMELGSLESLDATNALSAMLADREELSKTERDTIRSLGLRYRGRGRWPLFQAFRPGYLPWRLEDSEAVFLTWALRCMTDLTSLVENGELTFDREDNPDMFLTRSLHNGQWHNRWEHILFPMPPPAPNYPDLERLRQLADSKPRTDLVWELGIFFLHAPVREERGGRPHFPISAMLVEADSGFVIPELFMGPDPSDTDRQELLVKLLETLPGLPSEIVVGTPRMAQLTESVTAPLGIALSLDETPALWSVREELLGSLEEGAPDFDEGLMAGSEE